MGSEEQKKKMKERREREREREKTKHMDTGSLVLSFTCQVIRWCVYTPEMSQPNAPQLPSNHCC